MAGGHDVNLRALARDGVVLLGRLILADAGRLKFATDLGAVIQRGDEWYLAFIKAADEYARTNGLDDLADEAPSQQLPDPRELSHPITELDIKAAGITSLIWATGFRHDFGWVQLPNVTGAGRRLSQEPVHRRGITNIPGVYFLGLPWLSKRKSSLMAGVGEDAAYLAAHISPGRNVHSR